MRVAILLVLLILGSAYATENCYCTVSKKAQYKALGIKLSNKAARWNRRAVPKLTKVLFKRYTIRKPKALKKFYKLSASFKKARIGAEITPR
jgi:hypothetical protein